MTDIYNAIEDMTKFAEQTGVDIQFINSKIGDVKELTTTAKKVVPAINELKRSIDNVNASLGASIDDSAGNGETNKTWSADKIYDQLTELKNNIKTEILDGSPTAFDTLKELSKALNDDPNFANTLANKMNNKVDFSQAQTLTQKQKKQARENIGIVEPTTTLLQSYLNARGNLGNE